MDDAETTQAELGGLALREAAWRATGADTPQAKTWWWRGVVMRDSCNLPIRRAEDLPAVESDNHALGYLLDWLDTQRGQGPVTGDKRLRLELQEYAFSDPARPRYLCTLNFNATGLGHTRGEAICRAIVAYAAAQKQAEKGEPGNG